MEQEFPEKTTTAADDSSELKRYLLGTITSETERGKIEERLLLDKEYFEELLRQEEELIQEFADDELTDRERQDFLRHFLVTEERREKVSFARALKIYLDNEKSTQNSSADATEKINSRKFWRFPLPSPVPAYAFGIGIILTVSLLLGYYFLRSTDSEQAIASLNRAYRIERPFESRITELNYAPFGNVRGEQMEKVDTTALELALRIALESADRYPSAENLHTLGRVYLSQRKFDEAIAKLEKAFELTPNDASILSDLGTAYLEKSKIFSADERGKSLEFSVKALENLERALEKNPRLLEARFNKAVALQNQGLTGQAQTAWRDYLNSDSASAWADEARRNLKLLESTQSPAPTANGVLQDFLAAYRQRDDDKAYQVISRNREMIEGKLIPQQLAFLFLATEGAEQKEYLAALQYAGELEQKKSGDLFFSEIARFYSAVSEKKLSSLREAQEAVKIGYQLCRKNEYKKARENFLRAREFFDQTDDIWERGLADYWIAYCDGRNSNLRESDERLATLADFCRAKNYQWLAAQVFYWLSVNARVANEISKSFYYSEEALKFSEATFDLYNTEKTYSWLAEGEVRVRQFPKALRNAAEALNLGNLPEASRRQKWRDYDIAAQLFYQLKWHRAAAAFEQEAFELNAREINEASFTRVALARLSLIYGALQKYEQGIDFARQSRIASEKLPDENDRQKSVAFALLQIAHLELEKGDYHSALADYEKAGEIYDSLGTIEQYRYAARKGRLLCFFRSKNEAGVQRELPEVLALFEKNRTKILEEQNRNSYFDGEQTVYDLAIEYQYSKGNFEQAFDYSEVSRARSLLEMQKKGAELVIKNGEPKIVFDENEVAKPLALSEIRAQLPPQVKLIQYAVLPDKVLIWLLSRDGFETIPSPILSGDLNEKVTSFIDAIKNKDAVKQDDLARSLYQILFRPVEEKLNKNEELFLIPDKILFHLPFAALVSDKTGNFLIADYQISFAPSSNVFLNASENAKSRNQRKDEKLLAIGNPAFDRREFPRLEPLPSAKKEARQITEFYKNNSTLLLEEEATKEKIQAEMPKADVIHFAGHYAANQQSPLLSSFLVSGSGQNSRLTNYELFGQKLEKPKLVVLSACQTEVERFYQGEGTIGAGRTFLASGIPLVLASQWRVDSDATAELMEKFHRYRRTEKISASQALRRAQLEMLENPYPVFRQPYYWAGFLALGADTQF